MKTEIERICQLQPHYSAANTPEMQERGRLIRGGLVGEIRSLAPTLSLALGEFGDDFLVEASDGIGRKTELPWVRFCSKRMSPAATEGFYVVMHFSTDGSACHVTVGCGSSKFNNGSSVPLPDKELDKQTAWARAVVIAAFGTTEPFADVADFGAIRSLPRSFQRATAISKRIAYSDIAATDFEGVLVEAARRLRAVYSAQSSGSDLSDADLRELEAATAIDPLRLERKRQGYGLTAQARRAVELRAMRMAEDHLRAIGYEVRDVSATMPYDLHATKGGQSIKVEVKGTTSYQTDAILMTRNEVSLHRIEKGNTALVIVSNIRLRSDAGEEIAEGGQVECLIGWDVDAWLLEATAFRVSRRGP